MGKRKLATGGLPVDLLVKALSELANLDYTDLLRMGFSDDDIEALRRAKFVAPKDKRACVCGHSIRNHSQLSGGCYALPLLGCKCGGFRAKEE